MIGYIPYPSLEIQLNNPPRPSVDPYSKTAKHPEQDERYTGKDGVSEIRELILAKLRFATKQPLL